MKRADRAMCDALSACCTVGLLDGLIICDIDGCTVSGINDIPDAKGLNLITDLYAAHAFDALAGVTDQRELSVPRLMGITSLKRKRSSCKFISEILQYTVSVSCTCRTVRIMSCKDQLNVRHPCYMYFFGIRKDFHSLFHFRVAGSDKSLFSFDLDKADPACADLIDILQITQCRDLDLVLLCSF